MKIPDEIDDSIKDPMELAVAKDGRLFFVERSGLVKMWSPQSKSTSLVGQLEVFTGLEDGLLARAPALRQRAKVEGGR